MQKIKSMNFGGLLNLIKCCLIGIVATLLGTVIFAVVLKFANLSSKSIAYVNNIIKGFSIFIMIMCVKQKNGDKLLLKSIVAGIIYSLLAYMIFSILNGSFVFDLSFLYDLLFSILVSMISSVIINVISRRNV